MRRWPSPFVRWRVRSRPCPPLRRRWMCSCLSPQRAWVPDVILSGGPSHLYDAGRGFAHTHLFGDGEGEHAHLHKENGCHISCIIPDNAMKDNNYISCDILSSANANPPPCPNEWSCRDLCVCRPRWQMLVRILNWPTLIWEFYF